VVSRISFKMFNKSLLFLTTLFLASSIILPRTAQSNNLLENNQIIENTANQISTINSYDILNKLNNNHESLKKLSLIEKAVLKKLDENILKGLTLNESKENVKKQAHEQVKDLPKNIKEDLLGYVDHILESKTDERILEKTFKGQHFESLFTDLSKIESTNNLRWQEALKNRDKIDNKVKYPSHPRRILNRDITITNSQTFSAQVKASVFGVELSAGPTINFEKRFVVNAMILAAGSEPIVSYNSDLNTNVLNQSENRRIVYLCSVTAQASHKLSGSAGLTVLGTGATIESSKWEAISVQQTSELKQLPLSYENGQLPNIKDIENECLNNFYKKSKASLTNELKLAISELVYTNTQNTCAVDNHCKEWHRSLVGIIQYSSVARCDDTKINNNPVKICQLRGRKGNACRVEDKNGKRLSAGFFEYPCDKGLKCTITKQGGWFTNGKIYDSWHAKCL